MSWLRKNRVLVPIDFSEASFAALIPAREFVEDVSHLYVLHVLPHLHPAEPGEELLLELKLCYIYILADV